MPPGTRSAIPPRNELIRRGDTMGCFYVESPATRLLLKKLWTGMPPAKRADADVFEYLIIVSSIIRPAANVFADEFVRRAHGHPYRSLHPLLDEVLAETLGIMVYQEDVMNVAVAVGGFSVHDGDQLRKVLSKKHKEQATPRLPTAVLRRAHQCEPSHAPSSTRSGR